MHNGYTYKSCSTFLSRAYSRSIRSSFLYRSSNLCLTTHVSEMPFEESAIINIRMYLNCFKFVLHSASFHLKKIESSSISKSFPTWYTSFQCICLSEKVESTKCEFNVDIYIPVHVHIVYTYVIPGIFNSNFLLRYS